MQQTPVPAPDVDEREFGWADDALALKENTNWNNEERLSNQRNVNDLRFLRVLGYVIPVLLAFFALLFALSLAFWSWHYLTPWDWLTENQLAKIQSVIFSGTLGAMVSTMFRKQLSI